MKGNRRYNAAVDGDVGGPAVAASRPDTGRHMPVTDVQGRQLDRVVALRRPGGELVVMAKPKQFNPWDTSALMKLDAVLGKGASRPPPSLGAPPLNEAYRQAKLGYPFQNRTNPMTHGDDYAVGAATTVSTRTGRHFDSQGRAITGRKAIRLEREATRRDVLGGRARAVHADMDGGETWKREYDDGSYITKNADGSGYTWFNADKTERGKAKDFKEYGEGGRSFFGDLSTGEGSVTIGSSVDNQQLVRNFKDDNEGRISYDTYQMRNGKEYRGSHRDIRYDGAGNKYSDVSTTTAEYADGTKRDVVSRSYPLPKLSKDMNGGTDTKAALAQLADARNDIDTGATFAAEELRRARAGAVTKTDREIADYNQNLRPGVQKFFEEAADRRQTAADDVKKTGYKTDRGVFGSDEFKGAVRREAEAMVDRNDAKTKAALGGIDFLKSERGRQDRQTNVEDKVNFLNGYYGRELANWEKSLPTEHDLHSKNGIEHVGIRDLSARAKRDMEAVRFKNSWVGGDFGGAYVERGRVQTTGEIAARRDRKKKKDRV